MIMWKRKIKLGVKQTKLIFDMMLLSCVFNPYDEEMIEKIYATGYYTNDEQIQLNDVRRQYIEYNKIYKVIDIWI